MHQTHIRQIVRFKDCPGRYAIVCGSLSDQSFHARKVAHSPKRQLERYGNHPNAVGESGKMYLLNECSGLYSTDRVIQVTGA